MPHRASYNDERCCSIVHFYLYHISLRLFCMYNVVLINDFTKRNSCSIEDCQRNSHGVIQKPA